MVDNNMLFEEEDEADAELRSEMLLLPLPLAVVKEFVEAKPEYGGVEDRLVLFLFIADEILLPIELIEPRSLLSSIELSRTLDDE